MTAANDPLARVQAMVSAWGGTELFDTRESEVSPPNGRENRGFGHSRHFRHQESEHVRTRHRSADAHLQERQEQENGSRVSHSSGVESVESVEILKKGRSYRRLIFDTFSSQVSKDRGQVSKAGRSTPLEAPAAGTCGLSGVPDAWVQGVAKLAEMPCPPHFPAARWAHVVRDAPVFLGHWGAQAAALGWPTWELFGCHRRAPFGHIQCMGLVLLLRGRHVAALTADEALIRITTAAHQTYRRQRRDPLYPGECCPLWELSDA
jgi:hypothetical protein